MAPSDAQSAPSTPLEYFTGLAATYAAHRPTYPREAIRAILHGLPERPLIADIGCGTGISTRLLASGGAAVIGIDPNPDMLAQARGESPAQGSITYAPGAGESTGLEPQSVDAVVCAQSFHWFDTLAALAEFRRILRPAGRLALMWNVKEESDPFSAIYCRVAEAAQRDAAQRGMVVHPDRWVDELPGGHFRDVRVQVFANPLSLDLDGVLGRARSASYFPKSGPLRESLESELRDGFARFQRDGRVMMLYRTEVTFAERA